MTTINPWILATRPKTLFASVSPVILGLSLAWLHQGSLNLIVGLLTLLCALLMQVASNIANDYLDSLKGIDTEKRLGPTRVTHAGLIPATQMRNALVLILFLALLLGIYLMYVGGPVIIFIGLLSLYFAYGYTGGPFPLSHNGLGEVAAFLFFGVIAVSGTVYLQTKEFQAIDFIMGMGPGFISATILAVNNLRDIESDTETNKRTLAVRFGENFQRKLCLGLIIASAVLLLFVAFSYRYNWLIPVSILPLVFIKNWIHIFKKPIDSSLNLALAKTAQYLLVYCVLTSVALLLSSGKLI